MPSKDELKESLANCQAQNRELLEEKTRLTRQYRELDGITNRMTIRADTLAARVDELEAELRDRAVDQGTVDALRLQIEELKGELNWKTAALDFADARINMLLDGAKPALIEVTNNYGADPRTDV
jgi:predicted nuclease with TOPRIM domain